MDHGAVDRADAHALDHRDFRAELCGREDVDLDLVAGLLSDQAFERLMTLVIHAADRLVVAEAQAGLRARVGRGGRGRGGNRERQQGSAELVHRSPLNSLILWVDHMPLRHERQSAIAECAAVGRATAFTPAWLRTAIVHAVARLFSRSWRANARRSIAQR